MQWICYSQEGYSWGEWGGEEGGEVKSGGVKVKERSYLTLRIYWYWKCLFWLQISVIIYKGILSKIYKNSNNMSWVQLIQNVQNLISLDFQLCRYFT